MNFKVSKKKLQISQWITPGVFDIIFNIHPESKDHIKNNRRAKREERKIDKISAYFRSSNSHFLTYGCANTENMPFNKMLYFIHRERFFKKLTEFNF